MKSKIDDKEIPENIPVITPEMMASNDIKLTSSWTRGIDIGSIVKKIGSNDDEQCYVFLGLVDRANYSDKDLEEFSIVIPPLRHLGWFTKYPIRSRYDNTYESNIEIYAWYVELFEKIRPLRMDIQ